MKPRTLAILLALVVGLGAFVWFYEREQPGSEEREKLARRVLGVDREDVVRVELHAGEREIEFERTHKADAGGTDKDTWRLLQPIEFRADYWQVDGLVRVLAELERVRKLDDYQPQDVGLDSPRGTVVIELEGGKSKELRIGAEVPGSGNLIVAVDGESGASVVAGTLWASLEKDAGEWRDKDLFSAERGEVKELALERSVAGDGGTAAASTVRLMRIGGGDFELAEPIHDRADKDAVNALLRELTGLQASRFLDAPPPLAELGLDPPRARLTATLDEGEPFVLLWGARLADAEENYAMVGGLVVTTTAALDEPLARAAPAWRSSSWSALQVFEIDEVTATDARGTLTVTRDEGSWRRGEDAIQYGPVSDFLYAIDDAKAERIASPGEVAALGSPELTIDLAAFEDATAETQVPAKRERLELFAATPENLVPVRADGRDALLLLRRETRDLILAKLEAVRDAKPADQEVPPEPDTPADAELDADP